VEFINDPKEAIFHPKGHASYIAGCMMADHLPMNRIRADIHKKIRADEIFSELTSKSMISCDGLYRDPYYRKSSSVY